MKRVHFSEEVSVCYMTEWLIESREAQKRWKLSALERERRCCCRYLRHIGLYIAWCLEPCHREKIKRLLGNAQC